MLQDPVTHKANAFYMGTYSCSESYVGETKRNCYVRWREHFATKKTSKVVDHLLLNPGHKRRILEAFYIRTLQPTLNNQLNTKRTLLFKSGTT